MRNNSTQLEENLTWANIFVNSNYSIYTKSIIPEYSKHNIILVINENAKIDYLPFKEKIKKVFYIKNNAYENSYNTINIIKEYIETNNIKDHLFLFCAGPFGNLLTHQLWTFSKENQYLDIGSTLDPLMLLGGTRGYLIGSNTINKKCEWYA